MTQTFTAGQTLAASAVNQDLAFPTGLIVPYAGAAAPGQGASTAPLPWLLCDGSDVDREDYAVLFAVIATTYGAGDGTTTFTLPDLRGRVPAGADNMGGTAASRLTSAASGVDGATLGAAGGAQTHTLTTAQMPSHDHVAGIYDPAHSHSIAETVGADNLSGPHPGMFDPATFGVNRWGATQAAGTGVRVYTDGKWDTTRNTGGGGAHNNVPPTIVLNYLIKT